MSADEGRSGNLDDGPMAAPPAPLGQRLLDAFPGPAALLDPAGLILLVNESWIAFARDNGLDAPIDWDTCDYLAACDRAAEAGDREGADAARGIRAVLSGAKDQHSMDYACHAPGRMRWFNLRVAAIALDHGQRGALAMHQDITERHRAQIGLKASEAENRERAERLQRILDVSMDVICTIDAQGTFVSVNAAAERLWGRNVVSLRGSSVFDLCESEDRAECRQTLSRIVHGDSALSYEMRSRHTDGRVLQLTWSAQWSPAERVVVCVVRDISAQRAADAENERLSLQINATLENMPDAFFLLDAAWRFSYINPQAATIMARSRRDMIGKVIWEEFPEAKDSVFFREYHQAVRHGRKASFETFFAPLQKWLSIHAFPSEGGLAVYFLDVTERRRAIDALRQSEQRLQLITRVTTDATWEWNVREGRVWWSEGLHALFGLEWNGEADGLEPWEQRIHLDDRARVLARAQENLDSERTQCSDEYQFQKADGSYAIVHDRRFIERDEALRPVRVVAAMTDVTELRRAQAEAHAEAQRRALLASAHQELSTGEHGFDELMQLLLLRAKELTAADGAVIELHDDPEHLAARYADDSRLHMLGRRVALAHSFSGHVLRAGRALLCTDVEVDERVDRESAHAAGARSMVCVPLDFATGEAPGVLKLLSARPAGFASSDLTHLQLLAESVRVVLQRQQALDRLRESETQYRLLFEQSPHPMWVYDEQRRRILAVNEAAIETYGWSEEEFARLEMGDDDAPRELEGRHPAASTASGVELRRHCRRDGTELEVELIAQPLVFKHRPARLVIATDVTERGEAQREVERFHRIQQLLSACNLAQMRAETEDELLINACRLAIDPGGFEAAWVGYPSPQGADGLQVMACAGSCVEHLIAASRHAGPADFVRHAFDAVQATASGKLQVEGLDHPHWAVALPLTRRANQAMGVLCLYATDATAFDERVLPSLRDLAGDLSFGIHHLYAQHDRRRLEAAIIAVAAGVSGSTGSEFLDRLCVSMVQALDAQAGFVARLVDDPARLRMRLIAGVIDGEPAGDLEYECAGTPCEQLLEQDELVITADLQARFPRLRPPMDGAQAYVGRRLLDSRGQPLGLLFVMWRRPIQRLDFKRNTLRIFASRVASELERREDEMRLRDQASLLDQAKDAIVLRSLDGHVQFWNRGAERLFGWSAEEALGAKLSPLLHEDPAAIQAAVQDVLGRGEWSGVMHSRGKDGRRITTEGHWTLVRDAEAAPRAILAINTDISQRIAVEAQLQQSQRLEAVGQLTGGVAHDFNNLLTVILGNAELLSEALVHDTHLSRLAGMINMAAQRGSDLTHRLLAFARRQNLESRPTDVNALIQAMRDMLDRTLGEDIRFELDLADDLWTAMADPSQLESALLNLCINSRDAMPAGGGLTVSTANAVVGAGQTGAGHELAAGDYVTLSVSDTGCGIPEDQLKRVIEPFFTTKPVGKGTGLGLSMVYGFVKQSKGHLAIRSTVGEGTRLTLWLPRARVQDADRTAAPAGEVVRDAGKEEMIGGEERILVAEDDPLVRRYASDELRQLGYEVIEVADGHRALEVLRSDEPIDLLFTDVVMPGGLRGPELVERARTLRPGLRVLYTSGYTENSLDDVPAQRAGLLLQKPYHRAELARKIRAALIEGGPRDH